MAKVKISGKAAAVGTIIAGLMSGYTPQILDFIKASGLGVPTRFLAQAERQKELFENHWGVKPVGSAEIEGKDGAVVTCSAYSDDVVLVTIDPAEGKPRYVWVPMNREAKLTALIPTAEAAVKRSRKVRQARKCGFNKRLGGYVVDVQYEAGDCERRVINPATGRGKRFKIPCGIRCPM